MLLELLLLLTSPRSPLDPRPRLTDLVRFPPASVSYAQYSRCRQHADRLRDWPAVTHADRLRLDRARAETLLWYRYWDLLTDAQSAQIPEERLKALDRLEELIGCGLYRQGWSPPLIPDGLPD